MRLPDVGIASRRSVVAAALATLAHRLPAPAVQPDDASTCRTEMCEARVALTPRELTAEESPLIQELLKRSNKNKSKNDELTRQKTSFAGAGAYDSDAAKAIGAAPSPPPSS